MKQLFEYLVNYDYDTKIINEVSRLEGYETVINESFKSSIVQKLAQAIYDAEKDNNKRKLERAKQDNERYPEYGPHDPNLTNFSSIFGPKKVSKRWGGNDKGVQGLKWSEITDDDFVEYSPTDKNLIKLIRKSYGKKDGNADFIVMTGSGKIINFIKAYGKDPKEDGMFYFKNSEITKYGSKINSEVKELTKPYYSYQTRGLKVNEVIELLKDISTIVSGAKVYALEITDDMIKDYKNLITSREQAQKGVINYDKASLATLLNEQKARYKAMVSEIKAKKLQKDPNVLFDEIKLANDRVVALYKKITSKPEYIDKQYDLYRVMQYVSNAYESFYRSMKESREGQRDVERAIKRGESQEEIDDIKRFHKKYSDVRAEHEINDAKEYVNEVNKMCDEIEEKL